MARGAAEPEEIAIGVKGAAVIIRLLATDDGYRMGIRMEYRCGNFSGHASPISGKYADRAEAVAVAFQRALHHFEPTRLCAWDHVITDAQRQAAVEMTRALADRLLAEAQPSLF